MLINENRWRAQRYGLDDGLVDFGKGEIVPCADLIEELIALTSEDAEALGCTDELNHIGEIVKGGTCAHRQLEAFAAAEAAGASREEAFATVVDMLIEETVKGL
jgi:carboxylate-amine ligase